MNYAASRILRPARAAQHRDSPLPMPPPFAPYGITRRDSYQRFFEMTIYKVQLMRDEKFDGAEENIEARTEKEAAEKLAGRLLYKQGPSSNIRAMVQAPRGGLNPTLFYER